MATSKPTVLPSDYAVIPIPIPFYPSSCTKLHVQEESGNAQRQHQMSRSFPPLRNSSFCPTYGPKHSRQAQTTCTPVRVRQRSCLPAELTKSLQCFPKPKVPCLGASVRTITTRLTSKDMIKKLSRGGDRKRRRASAIRCHPDPVPSSECQHAGNFFDTLSHFLLQSEEIQRDRCKFYRADAEKSPSVQSNGKADTSCKGVSGSVETISAPEFEAKKSYTYSARERCSLNVSVALKHCEVRELATGPGNQVVEISIEGLDPSPRHEAPYEISPCFNSRVRMKHSHHSDVYASSLHSSGETAAVISKPDAASTERSNDLRSSCIQPSTFVAFPDSISDDLLPTHHSNSNCYSCEDEHNAKVSTNIIDLSSLRTQHLSHVNFTDSRREKSSLSPGLKGDKNTVWQAGGTTEPISVKRDSLSSFAQRENSEDGYMTESSGLSLSTARSISSSSFTSSSCDCSSCCLSNSTSSSSPSSKSTMEDDV